MESTCEAHQPKHQCYQSLFGYDLDRNDVDMGYVGCMVFILIIILSIPIAYNINKTKLISIYETEFNTRVNMFIKRIVLTIVILASISMTYITVFLYFIIPFESKWRSDLYGDTYSRSSYNINTLLAVVFACSFYLSSAIWPFIAQLHQPQVYNNLVYEWINLGITGSSILMTTLINYDAEENFNAKSGTPQGPHSIYFTILKVCLVFSTVYHIAGDAFIYPYIRLRYIQGLSSSRTNLKVKYQRLTAKSML